MIACLAHRAHRTPHEPGTPLSHPHAANDSRPALCGARVEPPQQWWWVGRERILHLRQHSTLAQQLRIWSCPDTLSRRGDEARPARCCIDRPARCDYGDGRDAQREAPSCGVQGRRAQGRAKRAVASAQLSVLAAATAALPPPSAFRALRSERRCALDPLVRLACDASSARRDLALARLRRHGQRGAAAFRPQAEQSFASALRAPFPARGVQLLEGRTRHDGAEQAGREVADWWPC